MVPRVGRQGSSFRGAALYYLHDKKADTSRRVEHAETRNLPTQDPELGWRVMASTAMDSDRLKRDAGVDRRGAKLKKPVFHLSNSWHPDQKPDREHMVSTMDSALAALGLERHQAIYVIHNDEPHPHIHAFVNLVNPENGRSNSVRYSKEKLSKWAEAYEREHGIYCEQRIENNAKRAQARGKGLKNKFPRHKEKELDLKAEITRRYNAADSGKAFAASMRELGFTVAQGKRIVLIGKDGKAHSATRQLDGVSAADLRKKLKDVELPRADDLRRESDRADGRGKSHAESPKRNPDDGKRRAQKSSRDEAREDVYFDRDGQNRKQDERVIDAGIEHQKAEVRTGLLNRLQDAHHDQLGMFFEEGEQERHRLDAALSGQYGAHERALRAAIAEREKTIRQSSKAKRWYMKNVSRETEALDNDRLTLANIEQRKTEARAALENRLAERRAELDEQHAVEREHVPHDFEPRELDPLARSISEQQAAANAAYLGAAAPADSQGNGTGDDAAGASAHHDAERAAFMEQMNGHEHDGHSIGFGGE